MSSRILNDEPGFTVSGDDRSHIPVFIHAEIDDSGLDVYERAVYLTISRRCGSGGEMWESVGSMARRLGFGERKARMVLRALEDYGLIKGRSRVDSGQTTIYRLTNQREWRLPKPRTTDSPEARQTADERGGRHDMPGGAAPHAAKVNTKKVLPRAEKPNGFSASRRQAKPAARKQEPGRFSSGKVSPSEPPPPTPARPPSPAPAKKLTPNQEFIKRAGETWNEARHPSWPECDVRRPSKRAIKYLQELFASEDKDVERAVETVRLGLRWIRSKDEWASGQVFTFEQMLANEKLETAASKARHALASHSSRAESTQGPGGPPASRSGRVSSIQVGRTYHRKGTSETVRVVEDLLGNGQTFLAEDPSTGETMKLSYYELHPIHNTANA